MDNDSTIVGRSAAFPETHWTIVVDAVSTDPLRAQEALEELCEIYRQPMVNWFRRKDFYQDPEDLAHGFLAYLLEKDLLTKVAPRTGKFRKFLAACMQRFLWDTWRENSSQSAGGGIEKVPLPDGEPGIATGDATESQLDSDFALTTHQRVMSQLAPRDELKPYIFQKESSQGWDEIATGLGRTPEAVRKEVSRLRRSHWERFRAEVARIVNPTDRVEETRYLYELLFKNFPSD